MTISSLQLLQKYNLPVPRYTGYPPAHVWEKSSDIEYLQAIGNQANTNPVGIYIHIPFCNSICSYCGCHSRANIDKDVEEEYVTFLCQEISLLHEKTGPKYISNLHFGGGTPSKLPPDQLSRIADTIFSFNQASSDIEQAIEIDPRSVYEDTGKLAHLKALGFSRISLGIQDFNEEVQAGIGRYQQKVVSLSVYEECRSLNFSNIHFDLVYGLPYQTIESFRTTIDTVLQLKPDRLSLFSFAYIPKLKTNQTYIPAEQLPSYEDKYLMLTNAIAQLTEGGYLSIGMDHFALPEDPLALCQKKQTLHRNFQGYTAFKEEVIGFGESAISSLHGGFFQNHKSYPSYIESLTHKRLPTNRGWILSKEDLYRAFVIEKLMCHFNVNKKSFFEKFGLSFDQVFASENSRLMPLLQEGLVSSTQDYINVTEIGRIFIRTIASIFDQYVPSTTASRAI